MILGADFVSRRTLEIGSHDTSAKPLNSSAYRAARAKTGTTQGQEGHGRDSRSARTALLARARRAIVESPPAGKTSSVLRSPTIRCAALRRDSTFSSPTEGKEPSANPFISGRLRRHYGSCGSLAVSAIEFGRDAQLSPGTFVPGPARCDASLSPTNSPLSPRACSRFTPAAAPVHAAPCLTHLKSSNHASARAVVAPPHLQCAPHAIAQAPASLPNPPGLVSPRSSRSASRDELRRAEVAAARSRRAHGSHSARRSRGRRRDSPARDRDG